MRKTLLALVVLAGCHSSRSKFPTATAPLSLDRIVLYRNGVGYFERSGQVTGEILTLKVRKDQVNDLLKSLTIVERKTGRAVSVSMPLDPQTWANAALATLRPGGGSLAEVLDTLRGSAVTLSTTQGTVHGRIALVEKIEDPGKQGEPPRNDHRISLLDGDSMRVVLLSTVRSVRLDDGDLAMQFNRTLDASAGEGMFQQVAVSIRLAGAKTHDLLVSYVVAAPMWKPTYRVVLPEGGKGKALLQAWAVVDNTSGEEWRDIHLALTSGAPIAFRYDLHTPRTVERPDLTARGVPHQATAMVGETTYDATPTPAPPPPPPAPAATTSPTTPRYRDADKKVSEKNKSKHEGYGRAAGASVSQNGPMGGAPAMDEESEVQGIDMNALRQSTLAAARPMTASGQTRFELGERVTVPEGTSTMVAIVNADVEGEETFLFRPGGAGYGYETSPYRVVRFKNSTPFVLEPGPIGIYSGGSFVGEGLSETVGAATSATIPFAVETGIMVTSVLGDDRDDMHLVKMSRGVLEVEQFARRTTTYTVKAQTNDQGFTVLVRHPKLGGTFTLANRPTGTEDLPDAYLVHVDVAKGSKEGTLKLVEQTPTRSSITIFDSVAIDLLERLVVHAEVDAATMAKLKPIIDKRRELGRIEEQISGLTEKRNKLDQRAHELRGNLEAIARNPQAFEQRKKWAKQLEDFTTDGNKIGSQLADLEAKRLDKRTELEDAVEALEITVPVKKP